MNLPGYRERIAHTICDDLVVCEGRSNVTQLTRLFYNGHEIRDELRSASFRVKRINFIFHVGDPDLATRLINTMSFCLRVGHHPTHESPMILATNFSKVVLDPIIKIERNQHFSMDVEFGNISITRNAWRRKAYRRLELEDDPPQEPDEKFVDGRSLLSRFNDYDGLKIIRCVLGGVLDREIQ